MDYRIDVQNPFISALEGFQTAQKMQAMRAQTEQIQAAQQRKAEMQAALGQFAARDRTPEEYRKLMTFFPEIADTATKSMEMLSEEQKKNKINQLLPIYAALESGNTPVAKQKLEENIAAARNSGMENEAKLMEQVLKQIDMGPEGIKGAKTSAGIFLYNVMGDDFNKMRESIAGGRSHIQSSEILPDGTVIQISSNGDVIIKDAGGNVLSGKDAIDAVKKAKDYGVSIEEMKSRARAEGTYGVKKEAEPTIAGTVAGAKQAVDLSGDYAKRLDKINENISILDEAADRIRTGIEKGEDLGVGPLRQYLPKLNQASLELKSVASRLGLGVVSSVTFGALSEGELKLAMQTGLPTGLKGPALLKWVEDRKAAQQKLADYLDEAAIFLGTPGNTLADFRRMMKERKGQQAQQPKVPAPTATPAPQELNKIPAADRLKMLQGL